MTTPPPRSPRLLLIATVLLACAGTLLLALPYDPRSPAARPQAAAHRGRPPTSAIPARHPPPAGRAAGTAPAGPPAPSPPVAVLPPHGDGTAGDRAIQDALEAAWPADLPAADERELLTAGRALLRADATGIGRTKWPDAFPDSGRAVAPAFATARFRIQAAIARRDGIPNKAVVHLVWAGMDRGGTFTDLRVTDLHFTRTRSRKGGSAWTVQSRT
jgi:hypothetical protein